jgi:hypothetical protein
MNAFLQSIQMLFQPSDYTKPLMALVILIGLCIFGVFIYKDKQKKLKIAEQEKIVLLAKQSRDSQDLATLGVVLTLFDIKNR